MNIGVTCKLIFLLILVEHVRCADKPDDKQVNNGAGLVSYSDTESDEEDNFEVTETTGQSQVHPPEEKKESEPVKPNKPCNEIIFMKANENEITVPMDEGDYKKIFENSFRIKYIFQAKLQMILCDYQLVYEHMPESASALLLMYHKINNVFIIQNMDGFMLIRYEGGKWLSNTWKRSGPIKLYTKDFKGNDVKLSENSYYTSLSSNGKLKYEFKRNVKCYKIMYNDKLIWKKKSDELYPCNVSITIRNDIIIHFGDYVIIFLKDYDYNIFYQKILRKSNKPK